MSKFNPMEEDGEGSWEDLFGNLADPEGCSVDTSANRALTLLQLRQVREHIECHCVADGWRNGMTGEALTPQTVCLYDVTKYIILPATRARKCSYFEIVSPAARSPDWFISHWWGKSFLDFIACVERHAADRGLSPDTAYWVCAFALNQHGVGGSELNAGSKDNPFVRAIALAEGKVLSIIDRACITYTRAWCLLELNHALDVWPAALMDTYTAVNNGSAYDMSKFEEIKAQVGAEGLRGSAWLLEVYNRMPVVHDRDAVGLTDGPCQLDCGEAASQTLRQEAFPLTMLEKGLDLCVRSAQASVPSDTAMILNFIAGRPDKDAHGEKIPPLEEHPKYDAMNAKLRGFFASVGWKMLLGTPGSAKCTDRLANAGIAKLAISFRGCKAFDDDAAAVLAASLPKHLQEVRLEFVTSAATTIGGNGVLAGVFARIDLSHLRVIEMNDCLLSCEIPDAIGGCVALEALTLAGNQMVGPLPAAIGKCRALKEMRCQNNKFSGQLPAALGDCSALELVRLNGNQFTGTLPAALGGCVALYELRIQFNPGLSGPIPTALGLCTKLKALAVDAVLLDAGLPEPLERRKEAGELQLNVPRK